MKPRIARCIVVETPSLERQSENPEQARDLLPWADPYISSLLARHRLQAALDDSLEFLHESAWTSPLPAPVKPANRRWDW